MVLHRSEVVAQKPKVKFLVLLNGFCIDKTLETYSITFYVALDGSFTSASNDVLVDYHLLNVFKEDTSHLEFFLILYLSKSHTKNV